MMMAWIFRLTSPPRLSQGNEEGVVSCPKSLCRSSETDCMTTDIMPNPQSRKKHYCPSRRSFPLYRFLQLLRKDGKDTHQFTISQRGSKVSECGPADSPAGTKSYITTFDEFSFHSTSAEPYFFSAKPLSLTPSPPPVLARPSEICHTTVMALGDFAFRYYQSVQQSDGSCTDDKSSGLGEHAQTGLFNTPPPTPPDHNQNFSGFQLLVDCRGFCLGTNLPVVCYTVSLP